MTKEKEIEMIKKNINPKYPFDEFWFTEGYDKGFQQGKSSNKCSICKDGLENTQVICWTCFCQMKNKVRTEAQKEILEKVKQVMYGRIDWIKVFKDAYEGRKTSWYELGHIREWRNATDEVLFAVWKQLEKELQQEIKPQGDKE